MIKVAVISDIHGNIEALNAVLADISNLEISKILILGDLALMGPEPNETVAFIKNMTKSYNIDIIQGNTDLFIASDGLPDIPELAKSAIVYAKNNLSQENIDFLRNLPEKKPIKIAKTSILMTHGSPRANNENIFPGESIEKVKQMIENVSESLILCGHTHLPAGYQIENQTIVNVGSVGRPFTHDQKACYVVLEIDETKKDTFSVEHRFIKFDAKSAAEKLAKLNFKGAKYFAELLLKSSAN